jgi:hypothetical protein
VNWLELERNRRPERRKASALRRMTSSTYLRAFLTFSSRNFRSAGGSKRLRFRVGFGLGWTRTAFFASALARRALAFAAFAAPLDISGRLHRLPADIAQQPQGSCRASTSARGRGRRPSRIKCYRDPDPGRTALSGESRLTFRQLRVVRRTCSPPIRRMISAKTTSPAGCRGAALLSSTNGNRPCFCTIRKTT